ncbi:Phosphate-binding protein PstS precursor [Nocardioides dokdonensis FR1436]|uniref:Phosphate-binding protein PstS n=1 Tax=Nocardioides dokdonensis FR1436 TaxID=1300347 RepID=A0A1A9GFV8_9ACTN|nr:substrate-binding domain-containing protein [Nocardioides dokdonensis]ANH37167.1 Phosphate-binding protein PstS precursor [Nocardioides dokdonensis FR1436]
MSTRRARALAATLVLAALGTAACSEEPRQDATDVVADAQARDYRDGQAEAQRVRQAQRALPSPTSGVVEIDGIDGALTAQQRLSYVRSGSATDVRTAHRGEDAAFASLCAGEVDVVDSTRTISAAELGACHAVGLDVVQLQVASDAVVVAIKNETDVGGDCLSTAQVREVYRAGSPVTAWSQVGTGYDDVPLAVAGPNRENNAFRFFGRTVLDAPDPSLINLRSDYRPFDTDQGSRLFVVGRERDEDLALQLRDRSRERDLVKSRLEEHWQVVNDAKAEVEVARAEVAKGERDQRPPAQQAADRARLVRAEQDLARKRELMLTLTDEKDGVVARYDAAAAARARVQRTRGHVGYFLFSYYELFEDQLRPFEITGTDGERSCIFPSQRTITSGEYPLSRRLLLTTTTRSMDRPEVADFLLHYLDGAGAAAVEAQLVALSHGDIEQQKDWVTGREAPDLVTADAQEAPEQAAPAPASGEPAR